MSPSYGRIPQVLRVTLVFLIACNGDRGPAGPAGEPGAPALAATSDEPAGTNCPNGGTKVEAGVDDNGNGVLDDSEVMSTTYVCNGAGTNALVKTSPEPVGDNCAFGGTRIETGLDTNNNDTLDASEIDAAATSFVCNFGPSGSINPSTGINFTLKSISTSATMPIAVRFSLRDDRGYPLDYNGIYSVNTPLQPRFALGYFTKDASGIVSPLSLYTKSTSASAPNGQPTNYNPKGTAAGHGSLVENGLGAGDYTYTFPTASTTNGPVAVAYDATKLGETHVLWVQLTRQTDLVYTTNSNTFFASNPEHNFIPSGVGTPGRREIVAQEKCDNCHTKFKTETTSSSGFHGGGRVAAGMCNVCHNPGRTTNPLADSASFVHRIHNGHNVADANLFHGIAATYPQDIRACETCHGNAQQGAQALTNPSVLACKGCHDYVSFTQSESITCGILGSLARGPDGKPLPCNHVAGPTPDSACKSCHGPGQNFATSRYHNPVASPDPNNAWRAGGTNNNTNASFVSANGYVPAGADVITYDVKTVEAVADAGGIKRPTVTFKLKRNGTDVVFQTFQAGVTTELMPNFVGSPSAYFAFAVPQDNITAPTDFNASVSGYIKKIWDGSATGTGAGTLVGPDATGYYKLTLTGVQIPATATMLTGGIGYTYSLSSAPPLVQTNVTDYPWTPNVPADGKAQGGLAIPPPNVWKVAVGYTARRPIVDNAKCKNCHGTLGVTPGFHAGQRNDGPTCSFCHNPNRTSSGWSAGSKYFVHAIHAGRKRVVDFTWHATTAGPGYDEIEFPGTLNLCTNCHTKDTYDFMASTNMSQLANQPLTTVATGTYNSNPLVNSTYYTLSPYVIADGVTSYGAGFSYNAGTNVTTQAAPTTLTISPITSACASCHDSSIAIDHMTANGGRFYTPRSVVLAPNAPQEQCLICHGPGRTAPIGEVHQR
jgi:OmcA/MtrC family decaheme c-type cytochrome